ncbi:unnamed protein product [Brassicogethes aeneus]|uniref:TIL domain-containing protein n=1 Tax=Brassicogethes aeneus TaxID=1431903 RepID=A0A9P0AZT0_BRAAE|nr:unnamed protein product [Brassicogethes aeneus]
MKKYTIVCLFLLGFIHFSQCSPQTTTPINCTKPFEEYACGSACQTTCENFGKPCPIVNIRCNDSCYCIDNYARNEQGVCIPIKNCPKNNKC